MGRTRRTTLRARAKAAAKAGVRRSSQARGPENLIEDLRARGEDVWANVQDLLHQTKRALARAARQQGPRVSKPVRVRAEWLADRMQSVQLPSVQLPSVHVPSVQLPSVHLIGREERPMFDKLFNRFTLGFGAGYVLGARAGRQRYEQIVSLWEKIAGSPVVRQAAHQGKQLLGEGKEKISSQLQGRQGPERVADVMTPTPTTVRASQTVAEAANNMRQIDAGSIIVLDDSGHVTGIVTDRDIAVRAVAQGRDPQTTTVREISSEDLTTLSPSDSIEEAVRLMRDRAIRRIPVVESGRPVGIVSIGDLATLRDPRSALADISAEPPNR
jgi:CBS domain-containing protein